MPKANIHRRSTLEEVHPPDLFAGDAAKNGSVPNTILSGVRILSAPDAAGDFAFERATQQIGEAASDSFLAPHRPPTASADPASRAGYEAFPDDIVAIAQRSGFEPKESPAAMNRACAVCGSDFHSLTSRSAPRSTNGVIFRRRYRRGSITEVSRILDCVSPSIGRRSRAEWPRSWAALRGLPFVS
jgi:hypothetical protein